jgi:hypothetical protein
MVGERPTNRQVGSARSPMRANIVWKNLIQIRIDRIAASTCRIVAGAIPAQLAFLSRFIIAFRSSQPRLRGLSSSRPKTIAKPPKARIQPAAAMCSMIWGSIPNGAAIRERAPITAKM